MNYEELLAWHTLVQDQLNRTEPVMERIADLLFQLNMGFQKIDYVQDRIERYEEEVRQAAAKIVELTRSAHCALCVENRCTGAPEHLPQF